MLCEYNKSDFNEGLFLLRSSSLVKFSSVHIFKDLVQNKWVEMRVLLFFLKLSEEIVDSIVTMKLIVVVTSKNSCTVHCYSFNLQDITELIFVNRALPVDCT